MSSREDRSRSAAEARARVAMHDVRDILIRTSVFFLLTFFASALLAFPYLTIH